MSNLCCNSVYRRAVKYCDDAAEVSAVSIWRPAPNGAVAVFARPCPRQAHGPRVERNGLAFQTVRTSATVPLFIENRLALWSVRKDILREFEEPRSQRIWTNVFESACCVALNLTSFERHRGVFEEQRIVQLCCSTGIPLGAANSCRVCRFNRNGPLAVLRSGRARGTAPGRT